MLVFIRSDRVKFLAKGPKRAIWRFNRGKMRSGNFMINRTKARLLECRQRTGKFRNFSISRWVIRRYTQYRGYTEESVKAPITHGFYKRYY